MDEDGKLRTKSGLSSVYTKLDASSPSIMQSLDSMTVLERSGSSNEGTDMKMSSWNEKQTDTATTLGKEFKSLNLTRNDDITRSFQILDSKEFLQVSTFEEFILRLGITDSVTKVKVVSIFGNTGDGKSYTLNNAFFDKQEVFKTSSSQSSCTLGVWIAYDPKLQILCLDTEGLLSSSNLELHTTRLLLKVLAVSDVVIYCLRSERLPRDMFTFLASASKAFTHHFKSALNNIGVGGPLTALGPAVVIFHESRHTKPLQPIVTESPEDVLRSRFAELKIGIEAFSALKYVGLQALSKTDFSELKLVVKGELENTTVRSPRQPIVVFETLRILNEKFSGEMRDGKPALFPDEYFTCPDCCLSCGKRCELSVGHLKEGRAHSSSSKCKYQNQFANNIYLCQRCIANGSEQVVTPKSVPNSGSTWYGLAKYVWSGYSIQCPNCGEIYTSRQYWYGNKAPEDSSSLKSKIIHVWPGSELVKGSQNRAQKVMDGVTYISEAVASVCSQPKKILSSYVTDQIAPKYWRPNDQIKHCHSCKKWFSPTSTKHHCRNCGEGFCEGCSSHYMPVPKHGWNEPVRVCTNCYNPSKCMTTNLSLGDAINDNDIRARRYGEVFINTLSTVANVFEYPKELIKETVRPSYWVPDDDIIVCCICGSHFGPLLALHHCRDCGRGVCGECSANKKPVPKRNWENPVRVCDECYAED
ncbi:hypothetical protein RUM43_011661 [Polyplax serrata]|uniref:FYVE-type domain-containing protein n=1 Tax=Polyplax serrata TaxID=468196 RepID=A0AAN8NMS4_POLSC